ncbi:hypothetical protein Pint_31867 [Pistacia integerrima]|uniref:Uncharacterized protein n=1 Tax=Pistacia integerrima TaxID=434235 RepID=A0ACC0XSF6_9ROSI|nr:hypothetical protein Pint_31867 [Pistacia integerrima]
MQSGGERYNVEIGRRDGFESLAKNVRLPPGNITVSQSIALFAEKGLDVTDMDRLYNYKNTRKPDPSMDLSLLHTLRRCCPQNSGDLNVVTLDQNLRSAPFVDNSYYKQIQFHRGILQIDQDLALDSLTKAAVDAIAGGYDFNSKFGEAMVKLGAVQVLTGNQGEIRK